jgi:phosphoglycerate dehydrogenase-like enzyme
MALSNPLKTGESLANICENSFHVARESISLSLNFWEVIVKVLVHHRCAEEYRCLIRERFPELEVIAGYGEEILSKYIADPDILIFWQFPPEALKKATRLRWIQTTGAGVEHLMEARQNLRDVVVTNTRGMHADIMADYTLGAILMLQWDFSNFFGDQQLRKWTHKFFEPLAGKTLGIVGLGAIGCEIARRAQSFQMNVIGVKRNPAPMKEIKQVFGPDRLHEMLSLSDYVVLVVPVTPETYQMIGESELRAMKKTACLINIARGSVVVESTLVRALRENWIAGAVLDVFEKEPLPEESSLWTLENVVITPHSAGNIQDYPKRVIEIFGKNYLRWKDGKPLLNVVDLARGY